MAYCQICGNCLSERFMPSNTKLFHMKNLLMRDYHIIYNRKVIIGTDCTINLPLEFWKNTCTKLSQTESLDVCHVYFFFFFFKSLQSWKLTIKEEILIKLVWSVTWIGWFSKSSQLIYMQQSLRPVVVRSFKIRRRK